MQNLRLHKNGEEFMALLCKAPLKGGEGIVSASIILVERDASVQSSSVRRTALRGAGEGL